MEPSTGTFRTKDNTEIFYSYIEAGKKSDLNSDKAVILLHQYRRDHHSYDSFVATLAKQEISSIAIDFRGHGKSSGSGGEIKTWKDFADEDFQKMTQDVHSARNFLMHKNKKSIFIIGASIGANTALNFANNNRDIKGIVLLSPGIVYHGIDVEESMVRNRVPTYIFVCENDKYSCESSQEIYHRLPLDEADKKQKDLKVYPGDAHGTDMFSKTDIDIKILRWLK